MKEETYLLMRRFFFWTIFLVFVVFTPIVVYYSLGYKFDRSTKKFQRTGTVAIKTSPRGVKVFFNDKAVDATPCVLRELLPRDYSITLDKEGFYPYQLSVRVNPSQVVELDIVLLPKRKNIEKLKFDFNVYRFFVNRYFFGEKILLFTDQGIYFLSSDFKAVEKISSVDVGASVATSFLDLKNWENHLIFWNKNDIWMIDIPDRLESQEVAPVVIYKASEEINGVYPGFKERYLIIQDGLKVIALDIKNPHVFFPVVDMSSTKAEIFYDSRFETIYLKDKVRQEGVIAFLNNFYSLFKIELLPFLSEKNGNRESKKIF